MPDAKRRTFARRPTRKAAPLVLLSLAISSGSVPLLAGVLPATVKGKVAGWERLVPQVYADAAKSESHRYTWREPSPTVKQEFRRLSANVSRDVCIAALSSGASQPHEPISIKVTGGRTTPATVALSPGSRLSFRNLDAFPHVLYEVNNEKWAATATAPGSSREWAAGSAGTHEIRDQLFPSIVMFIIVDPAVVEMTFPDKDGTFAMVLPAGDYTLKAFFDGKAVSKEVGPLHVLDRGILELREPVSLAGEPK